MNKLIKIIIIVIVTFLVTTTLVGRSAEEEATMVQTSLLKGTACLQKGYSQLFLLVNEISLGNTTGQVDFLTARDTVDSIRHLLGESRGYFNTVQNLLDETIPQHREATKAFCQYKIDNISNVLEKIMDFDKALQIGIVPGKRLFQELNETYLGCLGVVRPQSTM